MAASDETVGFEFVEYEIFSEQMSIVGAEVLLRIQSDLVQNPTRGAIVKRTHGVRKARVADPTSTRGKSGSYRYLYLYLEHAGRIHLPVFVQQRRASGLVAEAEANHRSAKPED